MVLTLPFYLVIICLLCFYYWMCSTSANFAVFKCALYMYHLLIHKPIATNASHYYFFLYIIMTVKVQVFIVQTSFGHCRWNSPADSRFWGGRCRRRPDTGSSDRRQRRCTVGRILPSPESMKKSNAHISSKQRTEPLCRAAVKNSFFLCCFHSWRNEVSCFRICMT